MNDPTTLDVLLYLFEECLEEPADFALEDQEEALRVELRDAGFSDRAVSSAFDWLGSLSYLDHSAGSAAENASGSSADAGAGAGVAPPRVAHGSPLSLRYYTDAECERIDVECRGLLYSLEQMGLLDFEARERVIDRVMALDALNLDVDALRWVVLVVMLNLPGRETSCDWMEEVLFTTDDGYAH